MIQIKNLTKRLGKTYSLSDLNLNIERGIYALVGHNGAFLGIQDNFHHPYFLFFPEERYLHCPLFINFSL